MRKMLIDHERIQPVDKEDQSNNTEAHKLLVFLRLKDFQQ